MIIRYEYGDQCHHTLIANADKLTMQHDDPQYGILLKCFCIIGASVGTRQRNTTAPVILNWSSV